MCARVLGPDGFGALGVIQNNVRVFSPLAGRGLGGAATRYVAQLRSKDPGRAGKILALTLLVGILASAATSLAALAFSGVIARELYRQPDLLIQIQFSALLLLVWSLFSLVSDALAGFEAFPVIARATLIEGAVTLVGFVTLTWLFGLMGAIASLIIASCFCLFYGSLALRRECRRHGIVPRTRGSASEGRVLLGFSLPDLLNNLTVAVAAWIAGAVLVRTPDGLAESAIVNVANQWRNLLMYIPGALVAVSLPILSQIRVTHSHAEVERSIVLQIQIIWLAVAGGSVAMVCASPLLLELYGPKYRGQEMSFVPAVLVAGLQSQSTLLSTVLASQARVWLLWVATTVASLVLLASAYLLVPRFGAVGLLTTNALYYALQIALMLRAIRSWRVTRAIALPLLLTTLGVSAAVFIVQRQPLLAYLLALPGALGITVLLWFSVPAAVRADLATAAATRLPRLADKLRARLGRRD